MKGYIVGFLAAFLGIAASQLMADPDPRGRIHLDYVFHDEDNANLPDGHRIRRAWLGLTGEVDEDWSYILEADITEGNLGFVDTYLRYSGLDAGDLTLGHFKVPFGMDFITAADHLLFPERPLANAFVPGRRVGLGFSHSAQNYGFDAMLYGQSAGSHDQRAAEQGDEGFGIAARVYTDLLNDGEQLVHLGGAFTSEDSPSSENETARFSSFPESRATGVRLVDTGTIEQVDRIHRAGLEAAYQRGPLVVQGEYLASSLNRHSGAENLDFDGYYGQVSYVMNGGQRSYQGGTFRNPAPGSWELAFRFSEINLNDGDIEGGDQTNVSLGVNYYPVDRVRFMLSLINVDSERAGVSDDPTLLLFRTQVSF
ncbi:phosphate-selective porin OprO/OprP [Natronospira proteinivora]|uniref:Phosphate-selective porin OprO/OprP n=1 Tax=Natronospira proteinivora TaxID=1807133 RepID=A0ABT1G5G6_9GAMM|nr:porin [Natronospira proteinivora]MCP1726538.1 phosphate-selective porin OprO/OprP [Natronospira proteinivora]